MIATRRYALLSGLFATGGFSVAAVAETNSSPLSLAERFAQTLNAHDIAAFAALFSPAYVNHQLSAAAPPPPATLSAKQATVGFFNGRLTGIPDLQVSIETVIAAGDKVAASFVYAGTHGGLYLGMAPTGKPLRFTSCDIFRVADGLIVEHWGMGDIAAFKRNCALERSHRSIPRASAYAARSHKIGEAVIRVRLILGMAASAACLHSFVGSTASSTRFRRDEQ